MYENIIVQQAQNIKRWFFYYKIIYLLYNLY